MHSRSTQPDWPQILAEWSVNHWFEHHAAGFKNDEAVRDAAARELGQILASAQPPDLPIYGNN